MQFPTAETFERMKIKDVIFLSLKLVKTMRKFNEKVDVNDADYKAYIDWYLNLKASYNAFVFYCLSTDYARDRGEKWVRNMSHSSEYAKKTLEEGYLRLVDWLETEYIDGNKWLTKDREYDVLMNLIHYVSKDFDEKLDLKPTRNDGYDEE